MRYLKFLLFSLFSFILPLTANAEWIDAIIIQPDQPRADQEITTIVRGNFPDNLTGWFDQTFTLEENVLNIVLRAATAGGVGLPVIIPWEVTHNWGRLEAGEYRVRALYYIRRPNQAAFTLYGQMECEFRVQGEELAEHRIPIYADRPNIISSYVIPVDNSIPNIFSELVQRSSLIIVKDAAGRFYVPRLNFNNIPGWDFRQSYYVKVSRTDTLIIRGRVVDEGQSIPLTIGWNGVAYFPSQVIEARVAFRNIQDALLIAKDARGNFYVPRLDFNNIPPLRRGQGYLVKVNRDIDFVWYRP